jgi:hypothetical protein
MMRHAMGALGLRVHCSARTGANPMCSESKAGGAALDGYHTWFDLKPGTKDVEFARSFRTCMQHLKESGSSEGRRLTRRKRGFAIWRNSTNPSTAWPRAAILWNSCISASIRRSAT